MKKNIAETSLEIESYLDCITQSNNLREVNLLLTEVMAKRKIQLLIKGDNLLLISNLIVELVLRCKDQISENRVLAAAILGRLTAVARNREETILASVSELFEDAPASIESLADGDEKYYAALFFSLIEYSWIADYCYEQVMLIDTSEKARKVFISRALQCSGSLSDFWNQIQSHFSLIKPLGSTEAKCKRLKRITKLLVEVLQEWQGDVGAEAGNELANWISLFLQHDSAEVDEELVIDLLDDVLSMLMRIIELRFSCALLAQTYLVLDRASTSIGRKTWTEFLRRSTKLETTRFALKEAALVLARQRIQDPDLVKIILIVYYSRSQVMPAIKSHFSSSKDLHAETRIWWEKGGKGTESLRNSEHKMGNTEDREIGSLLIHVENSKRVMEKLERAVVPFLEISDPPFAETVKKAAGSYAEIANATKQLAKMRKLNHMKLQGITLDYDPLDHEMLGGHQDGIRRVIVERDGIQKEFGGKQKILVKPRVSPIN